MLPVGVGISLFPHATAVLGRLGLEEELARVAITTRELAFFNRFGQLITREPAGRYAGYPTPQFSIHRGDLQGILAAAVRERLGADSIVTGHRCTSVAQRGRTVEATFAAPDGSYAGTAGGDVLIGCDGVHSAVRRQLHPEEPPPLYSGVNMWRGVTRWQPFLTGATSVRAGWLNPGKMVIYPIRNETDAEGRQLINWVAEVETPRHLSRDWNREGHVEDFIAPFEDWQFDWLDVPAMIRSADTILEYPMSDRDPLDWWTDGRISLLGDAAHPMYPRGGNGAAQAILDSEELRRCLETMSDPEAALLEYERVRRPATSHVVLTNRATPPDVLIREVRDRTGDRPFERIEDVISPAEIEAIAEDYKKAVGFTRSG